MADYSMDLLLKDEVYAIVGAAFEVYSTLKPVQVLGISQGEKRLSP